MNDTTLLYRQVHPRHVKVYQNVAHITSQVFRPTRKDNGKLSVYDGSQMEAEASWRHFTQEQGYPSVGVMAVTVEECAGEGLIVLPDPNEFPEHVLIVFEDPTGNRLSRNQIDDISKRLKAAAERRGWQYPPGGPR